ncbi:hypothetical protein GCM10010433_49950 [Streptomyces pulveraceus]
MEVQRAGAGKAARENVHGLVGVEAVEGVGGHGGGSCLNGPRKTCETEVGTETQRARPLLGAAGKGVL